MEVDAKAKIAMPIFGNCCVNAAMRIMLAKQSFPANCLADLSEPSIEPSFCMLRSKESRFDNQRFAFLALIGNRGVYTPMN